MLTFWGNCDVTSGFGSSVFRVFTLGPFKIYQARACKFIQHDDIMLLLTNCEVHTAKYLCQSLDVRTE